MCSENSGDVTPIVFGVGYMVNLICFIITMHHRSKIGDMSLFLVYMQLFMSWMPFLGVIATMWAVEDINDI